MVYCIGRILQYKKKKGVCLNMPKTGMQIEHIVNDQIHKINVHKIETWKKNHFILMENFLQPLDRKVLLGFKSEVDPLLSCHLHIQ